MQNLRADIHNVVVHRYRRFHIIRIAQRCAFRHGFKPRHQIARQIRHIARHNQKPVGSRQLQIVGCGTQCRKRAEMLPLPCVRKNMRTSSSIFFQIPVGADGDMADLRPDPVDDMIYQCLTPPKEQAPCPRLPYGSPDRRPVSGQKFSLRMFSWKSSRFS